MIATKRVYTEELEAGHVIITNERSDPSGRQYEAEVKGVYPLGYSTGDGAEQFAVELIVRSWGLRGCWQVAVSRFGATWDVKLA